MENSEDENVQALLNMGFCDVSLIRKALQLGKNDLNEAVSYLTCEVPMSSYETFTDVEMQEVSTQNFSQDPPAYSSLFDSSSTTNTTSITNGNSDSQHTEEMQQDSENDLVFPYEYLVELEGRVFVDVWSIPYKTDESLAKCLRAATRLTIEGIADTDENCKRFIDKCMPECFNKLLMSSAVQRWALDVQEGIHEMLLLFIDLIVATLERAKQPPVDMLKTLAMAFDSETDWHFKNRSRSWPQHLWETKLGGADKVYARPPSITTTFANDQFGWMVNLINTFCDKGGLSRLQNIVETCEHLDAAQFAAVLRPFGLCAEYFNPKAVQDNISPIIERAGKYVRELKEEDFKQKKLGSVSELLTIMKLVYRELWSKDVSSVDELRLSVTLRMLRSPHFNAKMNALKELTKLIDDSQSYSLKVKKNAMQSDKILDWLLTNSVLTISLDSHIDQSQYCDKIRTIVEFIGDNMSMDELSHMWQVQNNQSLSVSENVQSILSAAAVRFNDSQLDQLFQLIHHSWLREDEKRRQQLVSFIGRIGHNSKSSKTMEKVLDLLWDLSHLPKLSSHLVQQSMREHHAILNDSHHVRDSMKKTFIVRCIDDIKKDTWVVPALKQMYDIANTCGKPYSSKSDRGVLFDVNRQHDLLKLVVSSLTRCHKVAAVSAVVQTTDLCGELVVDGKFKHSEFMWWHLQFLRFLLKDANIYLPWNRAKEVWDTLVTNRDSCREDNEACYEWFSQSLDDLENDTVKLMFRERLLKLDPAQMCPSAYHCLMKFMESTNINEQKMKRSSGNLYVDKLDLLGLDFLWRVCLECPCEEVAELAVGTLVKFSYLYVSSNLKRDQKSLHTRFITECYKRLNQINIGSESSAIAHAVTRVTKTLAANILPDVNVAVSPSSSNKLLMTERILLLAERYIIEVEKSYADPRSLLPHGASFWGSPLKIDIICESQKFSFTILTHSNDTVSNVRARVALQLNTTVEQVQLMVRDKVLQHNQDQRLLRIIPFYPHQEVTAKTTVSPATITSEEDMNTPQSKTSVLVEKEQKLPSVVMANKGQDTFEVLYQLTELNEQKITQRARSLILLIPSDPQVMKSLKRIAIEDTIEEDIEFSPSKNNLSDSPVAMTTSPERPTGLLIDNSPKRQRYPRLSPFDSLFRLSSPGMNIFRLRYNLEVLSSLLIPVTDQQLLQHDPAEFIKYFLKCGGLQVILNILQNEVVSETVEHQTDADTRRGCYTIALTIARFLLCDHSSTADDSFTGNRHPRLSISLEAAATPTSPTKREYADFVTVGSMETSATPTKKNRRSPLSQSPVVLPQEVPKVARAAVQVMDEQDFTLFISTLVRIAWFASASKLDQVTVAKPSEHEGTSFSRARRWSRESSSSSVSVSNISPYIGRNTSTGSISSAGSVESESQSVFGNLGQRNEPPPNPDAVVAQQALELLITCLQLRSSHLDCFFNLPSVSEFIVDLLTQPNDRDIRSCAVEQFHALSNIESATFVNGPRFMLLKIILKARLPLWSQNTFLRSSGQKIVRNCLQYFDLRCRLIQDVIHHNQQAKGGVDPKTMLEDEIQWLSNFEIPTSTEYTESSSARVLDNTLLTGHLRLIKTLIACPKINKKEIGSQLISKLLTEFLFPASKLILDSSTQARGKRIFSDFQPKCSSNESRSAAFSVLIELCHECILNLQQVSSQLLSMHHYPDLSRSKEFDFQPLVDSRPEHGLVGLKNAGATCYMNSILQQLFMIKNLAPLICTEFGDANEESTILYQLQRIFGHLSESRLQYFIPETFWKNFKLWGQAINVREQQDAFMFFTDLSDQVDEYLKSKNQEPLFKKTLQGLFSDQKICEGCPHKYEREEPYFALNLPVKCGNLLDSLDQFVAGEKLEGDNAYFCEKCNAKRTALKRTCIKTLPPILIMQLKRFVYDWESSRSLKFDHDFKFPLTLDMSPYTEEGISQKESGRSRHTSDCNMYELVGIVVHSGQASAGHYYSFIKDRRGTQMSNPWRGKWFKFNDITVEEFNMNEQSLAEECFGGTYESKVYDKGTTYHENRQRYWNAYLLFYERMTETDTRHSRITNGRSRVTFLNRHEDHRTVSPLVSSPDISPPNSPKQVVDRKLSQLSNLIRKGDQRRMFTSRMPASISHLVREENLQFMRNRDVYCTQYFDFIKEIVSVNMNCIEGLPAIAVTSLQLSTQFLFNTYFRTRRSLTTNVDEWCNIIQDILTKSHPACIWFVSQLHTAVGFPNVQAFLLECPNEDIRQTFCSILVKSMEGCVTRKIGKEPVGFDLLLSRLIALLDREVAEHVKQSQQFFSLISNFSALSARACEAMLRHNVFIKLLRFLLGETATKPLMNRDQFAPINGQGSGDAPVTSFQSDATTTQDNQDTTTASRRWSSMQSREFGSLHSALTNLVLHSDMSAMWTVKAKPELSNFKPQTIQVIQRISLPEPIKHGVFGIVGSRLLQELLSAAREVSSSCPVVSDFICHCSYNNENFSVKAIDIILSDIQSVPANELGSLLTLLSNLLSLEDELHVMRLSLALEKSSQALLTIIKNTLKSDEPKCYQCIKMLVQLANRSSSNKDYLVSVSGQWSFAVSWLTGKMKTEYNSSSTNRLSEIRSNETSKYFQRTMSAQNTLEEVTALLGNKNVSDVPEDNEIEVDTL
ncbi:ubiquitin carboxyl-terminal hydrolase 24-like [Styela clava]